MPSEHNLPTNDLRALCRGCFGVKNIGSRQQGGDSQTPEKCWVRIFSREPSWQEHPKTMNPQPPRKQPLRFKIRRDDGVVSKPLPLAGLVRLYRDGKLRDHWKVLRSDSRTVTTVAEIIGQVEFDSQLKNARPNRSPKPVDRPPKAKASRPDQLIVARPESYKQTSGKDGRKRPGDFTDGKLASPEPISAEQLRQFTAGLPSRKVVLKCGDESIQIPWADFVSIRDSSGINGWVTTTCKGINAALRVVEKKDGWLCLTFGCLFEAISEFLLRHTEITIRGEIVNGLFHTSNRVLAELEAGVSRQSCRDVLAQLVEMRGLMQFRWLDTDPSVITFMEYLISCWREIANLNDNRPGEVTPKLAAVAFPTFGATFRGMVNASIINLGLSAIDHVIQSAHAEAMGTALEKAVRFFGISRVLFACRLHMQPS